MALFCFLVTMTACHSTKSTTTTQQSQTTNPVEKVNNFSTALFAQVCEQDKGNVILSPLSADIVLSMVQQGAAGQTLSEMDTWFAPLYLQNDEQLKVANSIWIEPAFPVKKSFFAACKPFNAEVYNKPIKPAEVNHWVSDKTNGKIPTILPNEMPAALSMVLVNALYFKAEWAEQFNERATRLEPFYPANKPAYDIKMMHKTEFFRYTQTDDAQVIELPYSMCPYAMDIILPADGVKPAALARDILKVLDNMEYKRVALSMPKFKIEYERTLNDDLKALGIKQAFTSNADFSGLSNVTTYIDAVLQKTYIDVNENGTEAAAATAVMMVKSAFIREEPIEMKVNRPFLLLIRNDETGAIVFMGKIEEV